MSENKSEETEEKKQITRKKSQRQSNLFFMIRPHSDDRILCMR